MAKNKNWIQGAIKNPGSLTKTAKKHGGINKKGNISQDFLEKAQAGDYGSKTAKRAHLAETLKGFHDNKKDSNKRRGHSEPKRHMDNRKSTKK